jgi:hypothetical protein
VYNKSEKERMIKMTGQEFLNKVRGIKTITDIKWKYEGDALDPKEVKVIVIADGEKIEVSAPLHPLNPQYDEEQEFIQTVSIALIVNKFMTQIGQQSNTPVSDEYYQAVNYARQHIRGCI